MTATRTSTASAERVAAAPRRGRASACSASCRSSTTTCCRASPSARPATRASSARRSPTSPTSRSPPPVKDRADIERARARASRRAGPRRPARRDAHLRAGDARRARAGATRGCRSASPTSSPSRRSRPTWDMADLTYNQGIHGAQDTANAMVRAGRAVPRHHRRLARRRRSATAVERWARAAARGHALARAEGRRVRLRDERDGRHPRRRARAAARARARRSTRSRPGALHRAAAAVARRRRRAR